MRTLFTLNLEGTYWGIKYSIVIDEMNTSGKSLIWLTPRIRPQSRLFIIWGFVESPLCRISLFPPLFPLRWQLATSPFLWRTFLNCKACQYLESLNYEAYYVLGVRRLRMLEMWRCGREKTYPWREFIVHSANGGVGRVSDRIEQNLIVGILSAIARPCLVLLCNTLYLWKWLVCV